MANEVIFSCGHLLVDAYDFSGQMTDILVNRSSESLDATMMGGATRKHKGGVRTADITGKGYLNLGSSLLDPVIFDGLGDDATLVTAFINGIPVVACSTSGGYALPTVSVKNPIGTSYGQLIPFDVEFQSQHDLVHAVVLHNCLTTGYGACAWSTDASIVGTRIPLSTAGMSTEEKLYGGMHITTLTTAIGGGGLGISAEIYAASSSGSGASNVRITFSGKTCKSGTWATPIPSSALSTDQPFVYSLVTVTTGTSTGYTGTGLIWVGHQ